MKKSFIIFFGLIFISVTAGLTAAGANTLKA